MLIWLLVLIGASYSNGLFSKYWIHALNVRQLKRFHIEVGFYFAIVINTNGAELLQFVCLRAPMLYRALAKMGELTRDAINKDTARFLVSYRSEIVSII